MSRRQTQVSQKSDSSTVKELLNTDKFIASIKRNFGLTKETRTICKHCGKQLYQNNEGRCMNCNNPADGVSQQIWVEKENAMMNKEGVDSFITTLRTHVDRNQITSNFDKKEIQNIMKDFHVKWAEEIAREWDNYGIKNKPQASKITRDGTNVVWSLFKRAQGGDTMDAISGLSKDVNKTVNETGEDNNSGLGL